MSYGRRASRRDDNESAIVAALRAAGASVAIMDNGDGFPDLLVGYHGVTFLLEVKKPLGKRGGLGGGNTKSRGGDGVRTADQLAWWAAWRGAPPVVVRTAAEALQAIAVAISNVTTNQDNAR